MPKARQPRTSEAGGTVNRHYRISAGLKLAAQKAVVDAGSPSMNAWFDAVVNGYMDRTPAQGVPGAPEDPRVAPVFPEDAAQRMRALHAAEQVEVLDVWIARLAEVGWPVTAVLAPVLGVSQQRISFRKGRGQELIASGVAQTLDVPLVAVPPDWWSPPRKTPQGTIRVSLVVRLSADLVDRLDAYTKATGRPKTRTVQAAITAAVD